MLRVSGFDIIDVKPQIPAAVNQVAVARARKSHSRLSRLADQANGQADAHPCSPALGDGLKGGRRWGPQQPSRTAQKTLPPRRWRRFSYAWGHCGKAALRCSPGLLYFAWVELRCAGAVLAYPFGDYGEGIVGQQVLQFLGRECMARSITCHSSSSTTRRCTTWRRDFDGVRVKPLVAGRTVSLAATAVTAISIAWLRDRPHGAGRSLRVASGRGHRRPVAAKISTIEMWFDLIARRHARHCAGVP